MSFIILLISAVKVYTEYTSGVCSKDNLYFNIPQVRQIQEAYIEVGTIGNGKNQISCITCSGNGTVIEITGGGVNHNFANLTWEDCTLIIYTRKPSPFRKVLTDYTHGLATAKSYTSQKCEKYYLYYDISAVGWTRQAHILVDGLITRNKISCINCVGTENLNISAGGVDYDYVNLTWSRCRLKIYTYHPPRDNISLTELEYITYGALMLGYQSPKCIKKYLYYSIQLVPREQKAHIVVNELNRENRISCILCRGPGVINIHGGGLDSSYVNVTWRYCKLAIYTYASPPKGNIRSQLEYVEYGVFSNGYQSAKCIKKYEYFKIFASGEARKLPFYLNETNITCITCRGIGNITDILSGGVDYNYVYLAWILCELMIYSSEPPPDNEPITNVGTKENLYFDIPPLTEEKKVLFNLSDNNRITYVSCEGNGTMEYISGGLGCHIIELKWENCRLMIYTSLPAPYNTPYNTPFVTPYIQHMKSGARNADSISGLIVGCSIIIMFITLSYLQL